MNSSEGCPSVDQLQLLVVGRLPDPPAAALERHLLTCNDCARKTAECGTGDTLIRTLKGVRRSTRLAPAEQVMVDQLIAKLSAFGLQPTAQTPLASSFETADSLVPVCDVTRELSAVLRPAEGPDELGRMSGYRILKLLGAGGMGAVFLAEDIQLRRPVALKLMRPRAATVSGAADRFLREARAAAALRHDQIITIHQVGEDNGVPFIAMEYLQGESLEDLLRRKSTLSLNDVLSIGLQMARGLAAAHARQLIHRDIKPANVWLEKIEGPVAGKTKVRVKLLDFGLARSTELDSQLTATGIVVGTPAYMAPEQASSSQVDARADLFSLGVVLYRMTTGRLPFPGANTLQTLKSLATVTPASPKTLNTAIPTALSDLIDQLLQKDFEKRPAGATNVIERLGAISSVPPSGTSPRTDTRGDAGDEPHGPATSIGARNGKLRTWQVAAATAVTSLLLAVIVITIKTPDGKTTKVTIETDVNPPVATPDNSRLPRSPDSPVANPVEPAANITLESLDPKMIPETDRSPWQPKELVAVIGDHRLHNWDFVAEFRFHPSGEFFFSYGSNKCGVVAWSARTLQRLTGNGDEGFPYGLEGGLRFSTDGKSLFYTNEKFAVDLSNPSRPLFKPAATRRTSHKVDASWVKQIAISPDAQWMMMAGEPAGIVEFWDLSDNGYRFVKEVSYETAGRTPFLEISSDGRYLTLQADGDAYQGNRVALLWELSWQGADGPDVKRVTSIPAKSATFSPDSKKLVVSNDQRTEVYDLSATPMRVEAELPGGSQPQFSTNGDWFAYHSEGAISLYRAGQINWKKKAAIETFSGSNSTFSLSPDGKMLVASELGIGHIRAWDLTVDPPVERRTSEFIRSAAFSADGRLLATDGPEGSAVWRIDRDAPKRVLGSNQTNFTCRPSFSPDSKLIAFTSPGAVRGTGTINVWDLSRAKPKLIGENIWPSFREFSSDGECVLSLTDTEIIAYPWEINRRGQFHVRGEATRSVRRPGGAQSSVELRPDINRCVIAADSGKLQVFDMMDTSKPLIEVQHPDQRVWSFRLSASGDLLAALPSGGGRGVVWDLTEKPPQRYDLPHNFGEFRGGPFLESRGENHRMAFLGNERLLVTVDHPGMRVYDWHQRKLVREVAFPGPVVGLEIHNDGEHLATVNTNGTVYILRISDWAK